MMEMKVENNQGRRRYDNPGSSSILRKVDRSPVRGKKSVREVIMDERDYTRKLRNESYECEGTSRKKSMKD